MLRERGVFLRSLTEGLDTSTAAGRLLHHVPGAVAECEREVIKERTCRRHESRQEARDARRSSPNARGSRLAEALSDACRRPPSRPAFCGCPGRRSNVPKPVAAAGAESQRGREVQRDVAGHIYEKNAAALRLALEIIPHTEVFGTNQCVAYA